MFEITNCDFKQSFIKQEFANLIAQIAISSSHEKGLNMNAFTNLTRRHFFRTGAHALGTAALTSLLGECALGAEGKKTHFPAKAKHVIYLHMVGGPPQMDLYDYKPKMQEFYDQDLPDSIRQGQRLTTMTSGQARFPIAPSKYKFEQHGKSAMWVGELLPH